MHFIHDEDEYETVFTSRPCTTCNGGLKRCDGRCNGMASIGSRRRAPKEIARIKDERRVAEEDRTLAEADLIRTRRAALHHGGRPRPSGFRRKQ